MWSYGPLDDGLPQRSLRPSQGSRQVLHVAATSTEAHAEHDGCLVVLPDMRLSIACAATDAEYQNRIILHDNTLNLPVMQPHLDPNYAPHTAARRVAAA